MPEFRSDREHAKWASLQASAGKPFDKMLSGKATEQDLKAAGILIGRLSKLAEQVFDDGIKGIEATADAYIDSLNKKRIDEGKRPLTPKAQERLFHRTYSEVMKEASLDIIGQLHDVITQEIESSDTRLSKSVIQSLDRLRKSLPDVEDVQYKDGAKSNAEVESEKRKRAKRKNDTGERLDMQAALASIQTLVKDNTGEYDKRHPFGDIYGDEDDDEGFDFRTPLSVAKDSKGEVSRGNGPSPETLAAIGETNPVVLLPQTTEAAVIEGINSQRTFQQMILDALADKKEADEKEAAEADKDDDEKSTNWFRKLNGWMGGLKSKVKKVAGNSWIQAILTTLGLALTSPQLFTTLAEKAKEIFTLENIKKVLTEAWDWVTDAASSLFKWVADKLGLGGNDKKPTEGKTDDQLAKDAETMLPRVMEKIAQKEKMLKGVEDRKAKAGGDESKLSSYDRELLTVLPAQLKDLREYKDKYTKAKEKKADATKPGDASAVGGSSPSGPATGTFGGDSAAVANPSSDKPPSDIEKTAQLMKQSADASKPVDGPGSDKSAAGDATLTVNNGNTVNNTATAPSQTVVTPESNAKMPDVTAVDDPAKKAEAAAQAANTGAMKSSNAISLANFGLTPGTDDRLHLLNTGLV